MAKTTKKDFETFQKFCNHYLTEWGLSGWKIYYEHKKLDNAYAQVLIDLNGRLATVCLADDWGSQPIIPDTLQAVAKHETIHIILGRLDSCGKSRYVSESEIYEATEEAVRILEKLLP